MKRDIEFAHANVKKFAEAQKSTVSDFETEVVPGLIAGPKGDPSECSRLFCSWRSL